MNYKTAAGPKKKIVLRGKRNQAKASSYPVGGVSESSLPARGTERNVEQLLSDIVTRLERIEEKIDENIYPPEPAITPEFIKSMKKARADIKTGKGKAYDSIDDFFQEIET
jgi:hypothetical protein